MQPEIRYVVTFSGEQYNFIKAMFLEHHLAHQRIIDCFYDKLDDLKDYSLLTAHELKTVNDRIKGEIAEANREFRLKEEILQALDYAHVG